MSMLPSIAPERKIVVSVVSNIVPSKVFEIWLLRFIMLMNIKTHQYINPNA